MMVHDEMKRLMGEFGLELTEDVDQEIADQLKRAEKLDEVDTVTFGLQTDDDKIVKVFVNAKDAEKFEKIMADCLGSTDSIEDAINKAAAEVDIIDVEWPDEEEEDDAADAEDNGSSAMDPAVYGDDAKDKSKKTVAKKDDTTAAMEGLSYGEHFSHQLNEDHGSISSRMTTPNQQLIYQALLDLGVPEVALDRSPYRAAIIKGLRIAAQELQSNGTAKVALKAFVKGRIDDNKHSKDHDITKKDKVEPPKDDAPDDKAPADKKPVVDKKDDKAPTKKPIVKEDAPIAGSPAVDEVTMTEAEDGMLIVCGNVKVQLDLEELERVLKALAEKATTVIGQFTVSPRGSAMTLKQRGAADRIMMDAPKVAEFKELATKLLGE
jgi:hypothetical protein